MFRYIFQLLSPLCCISLPWSNPSLPSLLQQIFSTCCPCFSFSTLDFILGLQSVSHYHGCRIITTIWQPSPVAFISLSLSLKTLRLMCNQDECKSQFAQSNHIHAWFLVKIISPFILKRDPSIAMFCDQCPWALCNLPLIQLSLHLSLQGCSICYSLIICGKGLSWLPFHSLFHESGTLIIQLSRCPLTALSLLYFQMSFLWSLTGSPNPTLPFLIFFSSELLSTHPYVYLPLLECRVHVKKELIDMFILFF